LNKFIVSEKRKEKSKVEIVLGLATWKLIGYPIYFLLCGIIALAIVHKTSIPDKWWAWAITLVVCWIVLWRILLFGFWVGLVLLIPGTILVALVYLKKDKLKEPEKEEEIG